MGVNRRACLVIMDSCRKFSTQFAPQILAASIAQIENFGSPDKWNQPAPDSVRIVLVAFQLSLQKPLLEQYSRGD